MGTHTIELSVEPTISGWRHEGKLLDKSSLLEELNRKVKGYVDDLENELLAGDIERNNERETWRRIHWLYLAICPDLLHGRPLYYREIATQEAETRANPPGEDTIGKPVVTFAKLLEIQLPHKPGRPQAE